MKIFIKINLGYYQMLSVMTSLSKLQVNKNMITGMVFFQLAFGSWIVDSYTVLFF